MVLDDTRHSWLLNLQKLLALTHVNIFAFQQIRIEKYQQYHLVEKVHTFFRHQQGNYPDQVEFLLFLEYF